MSTHYNPEQGGGREHFIDPAYQDQQTIIDALPVPADEDPVSHYGFQDATEFLHYIQDNLVTGTTDVSRVLETFSGPKCPYCEELEPDRDPTLEVVDEDPIINDAPHRPDVEEIEYDIIDAFCDTHFDAWIEYMEKTVREDDSGIGEDGV